MKTTSTYESITTTTKDGQTYTYMFRKKRVKHKASKQSGHKSGRVGGRWYFYQECLERDDAPSRIVVKEWFAKQGFELIDNPKTTGPDLVLLTPDGRHSGIYVELYHNRQWINKWPWDNLSIKQGKAKDLLKYGKVYTVVLSKDFTQLGLVNYEHILDVIYEDNLYELPNRNVVDEFCYPLPKEFIKIVGVNDKPKVVSPTYFE